MARYRTPPVSLAHLLVVTMLAWLAAGTPAVAENPPATQPAAEAGRVVHVFDFEERELGNLEDLPMWWSKVSGPGLPHWVNGKLATDAARSGRYSFRLDLDGGSLIYRLQPGRLRVAQGGHYRVRGFVRTTQLKWAKARLVAYFTDRDGRMIEGSVRQSEPFASEAATPDEWHPLEVELSPQTKRAAWLVIELGLLQPMHLTETNANKNEPADARFRQDVHGSAWFDDVVVSQVPHIELSCPAPGNVFRKSQPTVLRVHVDDRYAKDLAATLIVRDADGTEIFRSMEPFAEKGKATETGGVTLDLPVTPLPAGWYRAQVRVAPATDALTHATADAAPKRTTDLEHASVSLLDDTSGVVITRTPSQVATNAPAAIADPFANRPLATPQAQVGAMVTDDAAAVATMTFVRLPDDLADPPLDRRFGVDATHLPVAAWSRLPEVLPTLAAGRVKLAVWQSDQDVTDGHGELFDALLVKLSAARIVPTGVLAGVPPRVAQDVGGKTWSDMLFAPREAWQPPLAFLIARHAHQLDRWQLGRDADARLFLEQPALRQLYQEVYREFARLVRNPNLAMPWPAWYGLVEERPGAEREVPATLSLAVPPDVLPEQIPLYIDEFDRLGLAGLSLALAPIDSDRYGRLASMRDLAQRITYALAGGADAVDVPYPFEAPTATPAETVEGMKNPSVEIAPDQPLESYLVTRTMLTHLAGAKYVGRVPVEPGVEAFLFERDRQAGGRRDEEDDRGVLVLWGPALRTANERTIELHLGEKAELVDLLGNRQPLVQGADDQISGRATIPVGPTPVLVVGIDAPLTALRTRLTVDNPMLESSFEPHRRTLRFVSPFDVPVSGTVRLLPPKGWHATISEPRLRVAPGEAFKLPIELQFPYNEFAGEKRVEAEFTLNVMGRTKRIRVPVTLTLGLTNVGLRTIVLREGNDVVVEQHVTNYGDVPVVFTGFVLYPGEARQERLIADLGPGETTVKKYRFNSPQNTTASALRSGLRELEGTRILNEYVELQ